MGDNARNNCKRREMIVSTESSSTTAAPAAFSKKMKLDFDFDFCYEKLKLPSLTNFNRHHLFTVSPDNTVSPATSSNSGSFLAGNLVSCDSTASRSSSNDSTGVVRNSLSFVDLKVMKSFETESSSTCINNKFRETSPSSSFYGDTDEMESPAPVVKNCRKIRLPAEKVPSQVEIDEFFAEAEKKEQKRFADKYNYDIVKDLPLEGRYQWVRLKP
ncbi:cyclin-dependent kinase inhibitor 7 isoform X2 [Ricinus communis]|uniref:cyclin-dependent kinase inhibitor 7 isoform X2 n=1 Tax=Ricinus communis TaxID=3988 RepID=UPI0007724481|nr:cyclin-dependent kinase inhibitor 7 isoform X2 [Ricinus communis]|eukprot:XP_015574362.1 cyclin-dependent kinase inhibitor 7 isoform X2 [Ricinus communis]